jgi:hypothetical protein
MWSFHPGVQPPARPARPARPTHRVRNKHPPRSNLPFIPTNPSLVQAFRIAMSGVNELPLPGTIRMLPRPVPEFLRPTLFTQDRTLKEWYALCDTYESWKGCSQEEWTNEDRYNPFIHLAAAGRLLRVEIQQQMKLRFVVRKWIARVRTRLYMRRLVGDTDLRTLEPIANKDAIQVVCLTTKSVYQFHVYSVIRMIQENLSFEQWGLAKPMAPRNPYTNQRWSFPQLLHIFQELQRNMGTRGKTLPSLLVHFIEARYCLRTFLKQNILQLGIDAAHRFFQSSDSDEIRREILFEMFQQVYQTHNMRMYRSVLAKQYTTTLQQEWERLIQNKWLHDNYSYSPDYMWRDTIEQHSSIEQLITKTTRYMRHVIVQQNPIAILISVAIPLGEPLPESSNGEERDN